MLAETVDKKIYIRYILIYSIIRLGHKIMISLYRSNDRYIDNQDNQDAHTKSCNATISIDLPDILFISLNSLVYHPIEEYRKCLIDCCIASFRSLYGFTIDSDNYRSLSNNRFEIKISCACFVLASDQISKFNINDYIGLYLISSDFASNMLRMNDEVIIKNMLFMKMENHSYREYQHRFKQVSNIVSDMRKVTSVDYDFIGPAVDTILDEFQIEKIFSNRHKALYKYNKYVININDAVLRSQQSRYPMIILSIAMFDRKTQILKLRDLLHIIGSNISVASAETNTDNEMVDMMVKRDFTIFANGLMIIEVSTRDEADKVVEIFST